jgi:hypothetical protein
MRTLLSLFLPAAFLGVVALSGPVLTGCDSSSPFVCESTDVFAVEDTTPDSVTTFGATIEPGACVVVRYEGRLADGGEVFDASPASGRALPVSGLILGFQQAIIGRRVGQSFTATIPPTLGYGAREQGSIPSCSTLEFDVTILDTAAPAACR